MNNSKIFFHMYGSSSNVPFKFYTQKGFPQFLFVGIGEHVSINKSLFKVLGKCTYDNGDIKFSIEPM